MLHTSEILRTTPNYGLLLLPRGGKGRGRGRGAEVSTMLTPPPRLLSSSFCPCLTRLTRALTVRQQPSLLAGDSETRQARKRYGHVEYGVGEGEGRGEGDGRK